MKHDTLALLVGILCIVASAPGLSAETKAPAASPAPEAAKEEQPKDEFRAIREVLGGKLLLGVAVATAAGCVGMMLLAAGLLPGQVARAERALRRGPWRVVLVGIVGVAALVFAAMALGTAGKAGAPGLGLVAIGILGFLVWLGAIGLAATAKLVGQGLLRDDAGTQPPWRTVGTGGLALAAAALVPLFGAAAFLFFLCRGVGAATLALLPTGDAPPTSDPAANSTGQPLA